MCSRISVCVCVCIHKYLYYTYMYLRQYMILLRETVLVFDSYSYLVLYCSEVSFNIVLLFLLTRSKLLIPVHKIQTFSFVF